jgi:hypothetical protein
MEINPMTLEYGKEKFELFSRLTETLQTYLKSNKIEKALKIAHERHGVLVSLLENAAIIGLDRSQYAMQAMECVRSEQSLAKHGTSQNRSDFISRKSAFKAYGTYAA